MHNLFCVRVFVQRLAESSSQNYREARLALTPTYTYFCQTYTRLDAGNLTHYLHVSLTYIMIKKLNPN